MIVVDVNLLLYANIDGFPHHAEAHAWLTRALNGDEPIGLPSVSVFGFVRIASNPRVFESPLSVGDALERVESWLARPHVSFLVPGPRHVEIAFRLLRELGAARNLTTDTQIAALAIEHQAELCSSDTDFARFPGLRWRNPLALGSRANEP